MSYNFDPISEMAINEGFNVYCKTCKCDTLLTYWGVCYCCEGSNIVIGDN